MSAVPAPVLAAIGRLNAHARVPGGHGSTERHAIYDYKTFAAMLLASGSEASVRLVFWSGSCSRCTDGWNFDYSDPDYRSRCRHCDGGGRKRLHFTEMTLRDGQVWHHPWEGRDGSGFQIAHAAGMKVAPPPAGAHDLLDPAGAIVPWHEVTGWAPGLPGTALAVDELFALLNQVEDWVEAAPPIVRGAPWWYLAESAKRCLHQQAHRGILGSPGHAYRIYLGRAPGGCCICGNSENLAGYTFGRYSTLFSWSLPICRQHTNSPHPTDPPPEALLTPTVRQWMARHERVVEAA